MKSMQLLIALILTGLNGWIPVGADEIPVEGASFDYCRWHCEVKPDGFVLKVTKKVTIFNQRGQEYATLAFHEDDFNKLKKVAITVSDSAGSVLYENDKGDLTKTCGFSGVALYNDHCSYFGVFESLRFPYSIEYYSETESKSLFYMKGCIFQSDIPVNQASFQLEIPNNLEFDYRTYGLAADIEPLLDADARSHIWEIGGLPAVPDIDYLPAGSYEPARLDLVADKFSFDKYRFKGDSWESIGESKGLLYRDRYLPGTQASPPSGGRMDDVISTYSRIRDAIRYVAIEIGVGGWRPYAAALTRDRGFGDCKDMATLLVAELRLAGIESYPVWVLTRSQGPIDPAFPSFRFNHVIATAIVGGDTLWMDPTCDNCPFGDLPVMDENIDVLAGTSTGGVIRRAPASRSADNATIRTSHFHIGADQRVSFTTELQATGNYALYLRGVLPDLDSDETRRFIDRQFPGGGSQLQIDKFEIEHLDDLERPVVIRIEATCKKPARVIKDILYCTPFILNKLAGLELTNLEDREYPLSLVYPRSYTDHITLTWDSALTADSVITPGCDSAAFRFGHVRMVSSYRNDTVTVDMHKEYLSYEVSTGEFSDFAVWRNRLRKIINSHVKLISLTN